MFFNTRSRRLQPAWNCQWAEHCTQARRRLKSAATPVNARGNLIFCVLIPPQLAHTLRVQIYNLNPTFRIFDRPIDLHIKLLSK